MGIRPPPESPHVVMQTLKKTNFVHYVSVTAGIQSACTIVLVQRNILRRQKSKKLVLSQNIRDFIRTQWTWKVYHVQLATRHLVCDNYNSQVKFDRSSCCKTGRKQGFTTVRRQESSWKGGDWRRLDRSNGHV